MLGVFVLHPATITFVAHMSIVAILSVRVIMKRPATGVALAWLLLIAIAPFVGALIYLLIGERRIGHRRAHGIAALRAEYRPIADAAIAAGLNDVDWSRHAPEVQALDTLARNLHSIPMVRGSTAELFSDTQEILAAIARDVDSAEQSILMEFYIWQQGGKADDVLEATIRAARRGVHCCLLIDALGARPWWKSDQPRRLREAGVHLQAALPVGLLRTFIGRTDLRVHRKIVIVDGQVGWTGSMNLVDPRFFKQDSGVGQWVDAMVRLEGSVIVPLASTMIADWILETGESLDSLVALVGLERVRPLGTADIQVIPSGPGMSGDALLQMILAIINAARSELVLTTPYLVPDDSLLCALRGAAARGVVVRLIVPEKVDSLLTRYASRSYFDDLLNSGIEVYLYRGGLLHTKSISVDESICMFGTVNLDMRSIWLNYEVALFVYDRAFAANLRGLQQTYIDAADRLDPQLWAKRSVGTRFLEDAFRLMSPLL